MGNTQKDVEEGERRMSDKEYNGWTNYVTWCVVTWFDGDEGEYNLCREVTKEVIDEDKEEQQIWKLAEWIKERVEDGKPELDGVYVDLLSAAISEINFGEIAEGWLKDVKEEKK